MVKSNPNNLFPDHFSAFIDQLNIQHVEYLLIGGYAMGAYGHIRSTSDLDIFIHATPINAGKMILACQSYGIEKDDLNIEMFLVPKMIGIGSPPLRIEILKQLDVIDFNYAYDRKMRKTVDGLSMNIISIEDLILLKEEATNNRNKTRDAEDLTFLQKLLLKMRGKQ